jgi:5-methylcytosine-specific restriction endonuclease McrA
VPPQSSRPEARNPVVAAVQTHGKSKLSCVLIAALRVPPGQFPDILSGHPMPPTSAGVGVGPLADSGPAPLVIAPPCANGLKSFPGNKQPLVWDKRSTRTGLAPQAILSIPSLMIRRMERICPHCAGPLSENAHPLRVYCSTRCQKKGVRKRSRDGKRTEANVGRTCTECEAPLGPEARPTRDYCSAFCAKRAEKRRRRERLTAESPTPQAYMPRLVAGPGPIGRPRLIGPRLNPRRAKGLCTSLYRYNHCCAYWRERVEGTLHKEHVIPLSRGGDHGVGNIVPACSACNHSKYGSTPSQWRMRQIRLKRIFGDDDGDAA